MDKKSVGPQTKGKSSTEETAAIVAPRVFHPKKIVGLIILTILAVGIIIIGSKVWQATRPPKSDAYGVVTLSNGEEIKLGDSAQEVAEDLGYQNPDLKLSQYYHPAVVSIEHPLQATFYMEKGRLIFVRINRGEANMQKETGIHIGMDLDKALEKTGNQASRINERAKNGAVIGLAYESEHTTSYYLRYPCNGTTATTAVVVVQKGYEIQAKDIASGCNPRGN